MHIIALMITIIYVKNSLTQSVKSKNIFELHENSGCDRYLKKKKSPLSAMFFLYPIKTRILLCSALMELCPFLTPTSRWIRFFHGSTGGHHGEFRSGRRADMLFMYCTCWQMSGAFCHICRWLLLNVTDCVDVKPSSFWWPYFIPHLCAYVPALFCRIDWILNECFFNFMIN